MMQEVSTAVRTGEDSQPQSAEEAARLAAVLRSKTLRDPLVLGVAGGGECTAQILGGELGAEFNVALVLSLRAPDGGGPVGAISDAGDVFLNRRSLHFRASSDGPRYIAEEREARLSELQVLAARVSVARPPSHVPGRSVVMVDNGVATGSRLTAAVRTLRQERPCEIIVALPAAPQEVVERISEMCDELIVLQVRPPRGETSPFDANADRICELLRAVDGGRRDR